MKSKRALVRTAANVSFPPILLKNPRTRPNRPRSPNYFPRKRAFTNNVCKAARSKNNIPNFRDDFRVIEFFSEEQRKISP
jgi:hypothetical protein